MDLLVLDEGKLGEDLNVLNDAIEGHGLMQNPAIAVLRNASQP